MKHIKIKVAVRIKELHLDAFYLYLRAENQRMVGLHSSLQFDGLGLFDMGHNCVSDRELTPSLYTSCRNALAHV
ncbi:hypothetical protein V12G01_21903 [Vibrio alginolyticus 12G01]|nr:hypothetical protein V12G01_21903 [Vibrio alginolyticus 12G01]